MAAALDFDHYRESAWRLAERAAGETGDQGLSAHLARGHAAALAELS